MKWKAPTSTSGRGEGMDKLSVGLRDLLVCMIISLEDLGVEAAQQAVMGHYTRLMAEGKTPDAALALLWDGVARKRARSL